MNRAVFVIAALAAFVASTKLTHAQERSLKQGPDELLDQIDLEQKLEAQLPLDLAFKDETGADVSLGDYFDGERPAVLALVYYECPMLCTMILNGTLRALNVIDELDVGRDFDVIAVSIDHRETPALAEEKKQLYLEKYRREGAAGGWHFLTGSEESIAKLAHTVGFAFEYDEETNQFAHGSAITVITPDGKISKYFYGIDYDPRALRLALVEASSGSIGSLVDKVILYCFRYNPLEGKYSLAIMNVLRALAVLTAGGMGLFMLISWLRDRRRRSGGLSETPS
ncbi:MAG: SCO family protein [Myxococcota bacterium]